MTVQLLWRCPRCRSSLVVSQLEVRCTGCDAAYPTVEGIPDLRVGKDAWIDCEKDGEDARRLARDTRDRSLEQVVRSVFQSQRGRTPEDVDVRTRRVLNAPQRLQSDLAGWLRSSTGAGMFLDLGCGPGMLLAAAAAQGRLGAGIDVSLVWLVVGKRLIAHHGGNPVLAAGFAESLPLADGAVDGVVSLDVIEHVSDPVPYLLEIDRVTRTGGRLALATPNRFSLAPEPHIGVWGVGWLPRRLQQPYAEWRSGKPYEYTRLLSTRETTRLLRTHTGFQVELLTPPIPQEEIAHAAPGRARLARVYNRMAATPWTRTPLLAIGAFFQVVGEKGTASPTSS